MTEISHGRERLRTSGGRLRPKHVACQAKRRSSYAAVLAKPSSGLEPETLLTTGCDRRLVATHGIRFGRSRRVGIFLAA
jgi:hypothetical protein